MDRAEKGTAAGRTELTPGGGCGTNPGGGFVRTGVDAHRSEPPLPASTPGGWRGAIYLFL
jgi:hypothetical protein